MTENEIIRNPGNVLVKSKDKIYLTGEINIHDMAQDCLFALCDLASDRDAWKARAERAEAELARYKETGLTPEEIETQLHNFGAYLCEMTGGKMSKTNYILEMMIAVSNDYQQSLCDECSKTKEGEK